MSDVQTSATIASLREQVDRLTDYNQRLLAENVQLTNRQTMDREEIESMATRNDELRADLANARAWIDGQDVRSDFPNATAMRQALDERIEHAKRSEADVVRLAAEKRALLDEMDEIRDEEDRADSLINSIISACAGSGCLNAHELRQALDTARERAGVLEREVRAYREWQRTKCDDNASSLDHWHACKALDAATWETDRTHALDAAKFGGAT